jgi:hypothetical protein
MDLTQGLGLDAAALLAGADRARQQLELAAEIRELAYNEATGVLSFKVQNQTGHKLISGFPEGRRMFLNIRAYGSDGALVYEVNPYDTAAATLKGLGYPYQPGQGLPTPAPIGGAEDYMDRLVYEMKPTSKLTGESTTFHFVLGTDRYKDNRIPPKGFRIGDAAERHSVPVWEGTEVTNYFTPAEYLGGYAAVALNPPASAVRFEVSLYYQTTSREYIEFLRDEIAVRATSPSPAEPTLSRLIPSSPGCAHGATPSGISGCTTVMCPAQPRCLWRRRAWVRAVAVVVARPAIRQRHRRASPRNPAATARCRCPGVR